MWFFPQSTQRNILPLRARHIPLLAPLSPPVPTHCLSLPLSCHCPPVTDVTGAAIRPPPCLPLRGRWHPPLSRPEGLASRREADDGGSRSPLRRRDEYRSSAPALLSLRTSDRCHWCGDPSASLASLSEGGGIRRSPARRMTEGVVPRFATGTSIARPPLPPLSCHCEPVTDVTGAAIRLPSPVDLTRGSRRRASPVPRPVMASRRRSRSRRILQKRIFVFVQERA